MIIDKQITIIRIGCHKVLRWSPTKILAFRNSAVQFWHINDAPGFLVLWTLIYGIS